MQEISELEQRITAALERIARAQDRLIGSKLGANNDLPALQAQLDDAQAIASRLQDRLTAVQSEKDDEKRLHEAELTALKAIHATQSRDLVIVVEQMKAEIADLHEGRCAEAAELADIIGALNPLIEEARNA